MTKTHSESGSFGVRDIPFIMGFVLVWTFLVAINLLVRPRWTIRELRRQIDHAR